MVTVQRAHHAGLSSDSPEVALAYGRLKTALAQKWAHDSLAYTVVKTEFIQEVMDNAFADRGLLVLMFGGLARSWLIILDTRLNRFIAMLLLLLATACAGLFCGAALYVNVVEHPARISCGQELAVREFAPSYRRATIMQASLAIGGFALALGAAWQLHDLWIVAGAVLIGASVPFTLIAILPTNRRLLDSTLDPRGVRAGELLQRWNRLHAVRTVFSVAAYGLLLWRLAASRGRAW